jgi:hypothetical protein
MIGKVEGAELAQKYPSSAPVQHPVRHPLFSLQMDPFYTLGCRGAELKANSNIGKRVKIEMNFREFSTLPLFPVICRINVGCRTGCRVQHLGLEV